MSMFRTRANPSAARPRAQTAARSLDREVAVARWCVLAAAFTVLLAIVLAHIGG
jgi:anti-sigma-K factor RskA